MNSLRTRIKTSFSAAALAIVCLPAQSAAIPGLGTWETTLQARDINGDGVVDAYYDTTLNITWLANMNAGEGSAFDNGLSPTDGQMTWGNAVAWVAGGLTEFGGGWRLPTIDSNLGPWGSATGELAHLFFVTLGNLGYCPPQATCDSNFFRPGRFGLQSTANFENMKSRFYWTGSEYAPDRSGAWVFDNNTGYQQTQHKDTEWFAVAVHDGDVTAIPEPEALAMMLAGLGGVGFFVRRRNRRLLVNCARF